MHLSYIANICIGYLSKINKHPIIVVINSTLLVQGDPFILFKKQGENTSKYHNIIQIHNNVMWDPQYFTKYPVIFTTSTLGGIYYVVDVMNTLSEHLNVVVSTNTTRHALHEACLGSLEKQKKSLLTPRMCIACWNLLNFIKIGLSKIEQGEFQ